MPRYKYKAQILATGVEIEGTATAADKFELAKTIQGEGKNLLTAQEISEHSLTMERINAFLARVDLRQKIVFARNLATMVEAGLPLSRALTIFHKQTQNAKFRQVLGVIIEDLNRGTSLSDAMQKFPKVFESVFVSMVRAGEESGGLVDALNVVGSQMEKTYTLKKKVKGAMLYPAIVLMVMIVVGVLMMIYVVPGLAATFAEVDLELPVLTRAIISTSEFFTNHLLIALLSVFGGITAIVFAARTPVGSRGLAWVATRLPIFGKLVREFNAALVTRTLSSLIAAGVDIVRSIEIAKDVISNPFYKQTLDAAMVNVQKGTSLSKVFTSHPELYPIMVGDMMEVGEETGQLSEMLKKIAQFYESEVDQATADMSKLIEPLLMVVIAAFVGVFAVAMITPMYSLSSAI